MKKNSKILNCIRELGTFKKVNKNQLIKLLQEIDAKEVEVSPLFIHDKVTFAIHVKSKNLSKLWDIYILQEE